jgi:PAS domain S-box-containing protein
MLNKLYAWLADQRLLAKGLWLALIPLTPLALTSSAIYLVQTVQRDAEAAVGRSRDIEIEVRSLLDLLTDAEDGHRTYLLTGDDSWLEPTRVAHVALPASLDRLDALVSDPSQEERLTQLPVLIQRHLAALDQIAAEAKASGRFPAVVPSSSFNEARLMARAVRVQTTSFLGREADLRVERTARMQHMRQILLIVAMAGSAFGILGGVCVLLLFTSGISSRVNVLNESADCLARRAPLPPPPPGRDEIGVLGQRLHHAAALLAERDREIRQADETVERFFTLSLDLFCVAGLDGYFKRLNPAWPEALGWTLDELMERPFLEFVHPDDRDATIREAEKLRRGAVTISFENRYRCRDGSFRWLQWTALPVIDRALIYSVARDVTAAKEAEARTRRLTAELEERNAQLTALNHELEAFSYSVSHDLRAPLRSIDGFSQILLEDYADRLDSEGRDALRRVRGAATGMGELIDALLALSRLSRIELRTERIDLSALAHTIAEELRHSHPDRAAEFVIAPALVAEGDRRLLTAAVGNLLGNGWKYTQPRACARIEFGCVERDDGTAYFVRDNGVGFDMAYVGKLFGAFQRLHRQSDFGGTGVGLATVQRIIHRHGGRVWAEGAVDQGATFYFTLPSRKAAEEVTLERIDELAGVS